MCIFWANLTPLSPAALVPHHRSGKWRAGRGQPAARPGTRDGRCLLGSPAPLSLSVAWACPTPRARRPAPRAARPARGAEAPLALSIADRARSEKDAKFAAPTGVSTIVTVWVAGTGTVGSDSGLSAFGWEMMGEAAPPRRTWVARTVGAPKRLVPEADGKNSAEARVAKSFKLTF